MKTTNYSKIAERYDKNAYRVNEIYFDAELNEVINKNSKSEYHVLDLSCGTGLYLEKQKGYFDKMAIKWYGLDLSEQMLQKARDRLKNVDLILADVENMPYQSGTFDYISNNYAFHHYRNKGQALDEIYRVLQKGGIYKLHNIAIHEMPNWWVYHYFSSAYYEDLKRYWEKEILFHELTARGFEVNLRIEYRMENIKACDYLAHAENRDISVLTLIDDKEYEEGLERMRFDVRTNPDKMISNDFAELVCIAKKL